MNQLECKTGRSGAGTFARAWLVVLIVATGAMVGCEERDVPSRTPNPAPTATPMTGAANPMRDASSTPTLTTSLRETAREAGEELRDLGDRVEAKINSPEFQAKKEEFLGKSRQELDELKVSIDRLGERTAAAGENAKENVQEWMADLRAKIQEADTEIERANASDSDTWEETQARTQTATERLKEAYNATLEKMKFNE